MADITSAQVKAYIEDRKEEITTKQGIKNIRTEELERLEAYIEEVETAE